MRTLLKAGHPKAMALFGYASINVLHIETLKVNTPTVSFGNHLKFEFSLAKKKPEEQIVRLEYAIHFMKSNGQQNNKVFKISELKLKSKETLAIQKSHGIKPISTRKYYPGKHSVNVIVNSVEFEKHDFLLHM